MTDVAEDTSTMALDPLPTPPIGHLVRLAVGIIVGFFAIFTLWGLLAPLDRAAIAPGELKVEGRRQVIQNRPDEHTSELQSLTNLVCRLLLVKKNLNYHFLMLVSIHSLNLKSVIRLYLNSTLLNSSH